MDIKEKWLSLLKYIRHSKTYSTFEEFLDFSKKFLFEKLNVPPDDIPAELYQQAWDSQKDICLLDLNHAGFPDSILTTLDSLNPYALIYEESWQNNVPASPVFEMTGISPYPTFMLKWFFLRRYWEFPLSLPVKELIIMDMEEKETWLYSIAFLQQKFPEQEKHELVAIKSKKLLFPAVIRVEEVYEEVDGTRTFIKARIDSKLFKPCYVVGELEDLLQRLEKKQLLVKDDTATRKLILALKQQIATIAKHKLFYQKIGVYKLNNHLSVAVPGKTRIIPATDAGRDLLEKIEATLKLYPDLKLNEVIDIINRRIKYSTVSPSLLTIVLSHAVITPFAHLLNVSIIPHLVAWGAKGTGKTTVLKYFSDIYGIGSLTAETAVNSQAFYHYLALGECVPVVIDEISHIEPIKDVLKSMATADESHYHIRLTKVGTLREKVAIRSCVVISTNDVFALKSDAALAKRIIWLDFNDQKTDKKYFQKIGSDAVRKIPFGFLLLEEICNRYSLEGIQKIFLEEKESLNLDVDDGRLYDVIALILTGRRILEDLGIIVPPRENVISVLKNSIEFGTITAEQEVAGTFMDWLEGRPDFLDIKDRYYIVTRKCLHEFLNEYKDFSDEFKGKAKLQRLMTYLQAAGIKCKYEPPRKTSFTFASGNSVHGVAALLVYKQKEAKQTNLGMQDRIKLVLGALHAGADSKAKILEMIEIDEKELDVILKKLQGDGTVRIDGEKIILVEKFWGDKN